MPLLALKVLRVSAATLVLAGLIWHVLPHLIWARQLEPELSRHRNALRLDAPVQREFEDTPADWSSITYGGVTLRVPLSEPLDRSCGDKPGYCYRDLLSGHLSMHADPLTESYAETLDMRAPDRDDLTLWRSASANWRTALALRERVEATFQPAEAWRYEAAGSHGIVSRVQLKGRHSHVLAVFPVDGGLGRIIAISGLEERDIWRVVGSIGFAGSGVH